jgi:hypothetical protein
LRNIRSHVVPPMLHVNQQSRQVGKKLYPLTMFESETLHGQQRPIYFNPDFDIVYFGDNSCITTIQKIVEMGVVIGRVAIRVHDNMIHCGCGSLDNHFLQPNHSNIALVLHGFFTPTNPTDTRQAIFPGVRGLREVNFVVQSTLWQRGHGEIDSGVTLRPAGGGGLTRAMESTLFSYTRGINAFNNVPTVTLTSGNVLTNKWLGNQNPVFKHVSLAPRAAALADEFYSSSTLRATKVTTDLTRFIKSLEKDSGCVIQLGYRIEPNAFVEVGFIGTKLQVQFAETAFWGNLDIRRTEGCGPIDLQQLAAHLAWLKNKMNSL